MGYVRTLPEEVDYVVVGAGSAGCVVANRLSDDPACKVLLIEAGNNGRSPLVELPFGYAYLLDNPKFDWRFSHGPEPALGDRTLPMPRGKTVGGSSSINAMLYVRGLAQDYDRWRDDGLPGWGWDDVEPYFRKLERYAQPSAVARGRAGPLAVTKVPNWHPLSEKLLEAAAQSRVGRTDDYNGPQPSGMGHGQIFFEKGRRCGSAKAYIRPVEHRPNLSIATHSLVRSLLLEGKRAVGVNLSRDGRASTVRARREVIVSAGAIGSPQLLEVSGIGDGKRLSGLGIAVRHELPAVGEHLLNHYLTFVVQELEGIRGLGREITGWRAWLNGARAILLRSGYLSGTPSQIAGHAYVQVRGEDVPLQFIAAPLRFTRDPIKKTVIRHAEPGLMLGCYLGHPRSRGHVHATSADIEEKPDAVMNMLTDERDVEGTIAGLRLCREILAQPAFDPYRARELAPGAAVQSDAEFDKYVRVGGASGDHPVGSCRMSRDAQAGVVDATLKVHGLDGLRIVDASVIPHMVTANTHAPTVMIGEKASDMILADGRG